MNVDVNNLVNVWVLENIKELFCFSLLVFILFNFKVKKFESEGKFGKRCK